MGMEYAREHIKRYWALAYRRALGTSMIVFSLALATGVTFTSMLNSLLVNVYIDDFIFWSVLIVVTVAVLLSNFFDAHTSCVNFMNEEEHKHHSRHTGLWLSSFVGGAIVFVLPLLYFGTSLEPLVLLFSFGGTFWVLYFSVDALFKHSYTEIAIGAAALWIVFIIIALESSSSMFSQAANNGFTLFASIMTLVIVSGATGTALLFNASHEYLTELKGYMKQLSSRKSR